jgi:hypothetical protein
MTGHPHVVRGADTLRRFPQRTAAQFEFAVRQSQGPAVRCRRHSFNPEPTATVLAAAPNTVAVGSWPTPWPLAPGQHRGRWLLANTVAVGSGLNDRAAMLQ